MWTTEIISIFASINHLDNFAIEAALLIHQRRLQLHREKINTAHQSVNTFTTATAKG